MCLPAPSHTGFPCWLFQGLKPHGQCHPVSKALGWMRSLSSLKLLPRAPQQPPPGKICICSSLLRKHITHGRENLVLDSKQNKMPPGRIQMRGFSSTADLGISLQSQGRTTNETSAAEREEEVQMDLGRSCMRSGGIQKK